MVNFKLLLTYKEKHRIIKSDYLIPIQTGRAIADELFEEMIGDNTGDNISVENNKYNELSAQYWAWKNYDEIGNPDFIGFMHYRRHFMFNEKLMTEVNKTWMKNSCVFFKNDLDNDYLTSNFKRELIEKYLEEYDCIVLKPYDVKELGKKSVRDQIGNLPQQKIEYFDILLASVTKIFPTYTIDVNEFRTSSVQYLCNMFVMSKKLFFEYSNFCFSILKDVDQQIDSSHFNVLESRFLGFMGELLLSLFIKHYYRVGTIRIKELNGILIESMPYNEIVRPFFANNYTTIGMSCSNEHVSYLSVCLQSLVEHTSDSNNYDVLIFEKNISKDAKNQLKKMFCSSNISLRFITINDQFQDINIALNCYYREECSYQVLAPTILKNYKTIIWSDYKVMFNYDIAELGKIPCAKPVAACRDLLMNAKLGQKSNAELSYLKKELNLIEPYEYYNTSILLINVQQYLAENVHTKVMQILLSQNLRNLAQDAFNSVLQNKIMSLEETWNVQTLDQQMKDLKYLESMDEKTRQVYKKISISPKIINFSSSRKPWMYPDECMADLWWSYARKTSFYEEIIRRLMDLRISLVPQYNNKDVVNLRNELKEVHFPNINKHFYGCEREIILFFIMNHLSYFKLKKLWYAIKKSFVFGEEYEKYNNKYKKLKILIKDAKKLKKRLMKVSNLII